MGEIKGLAVPTWSMAPTFTASCQHHMDQCDAKWACYSSYTWWHWSHATRGHHFKLILLTVKHLFERPQVSEGSTSVCCEESWTLTVCVLLNAVLIQLYTFDYWQTTMAGRLLLCCTVSWKEVHAKLGHWQLVTPNERMYQSPHISRTETWWMVK